MTEDDTFRRLMRTPFNELKIFEWMLSKPPGMRTEFQNELLEDKLYDNGWTTKEYKDELARRNPPAQDRL